MFGLNVDTLRSLRETLAHDPHIEKALIYGSRAKGNYKTGSDIDITLIGKGLTLTDTIYPLRDRLYKLYLPYKFDISIFNQLDEDDFIDHILRVGKTLYQRENGACQRWEKTTLGEVCDVIAGQSPNGSNYNNSGNGLPFYQGKKEFGDKYLGAPTKWTTQVTQEAIAGDVLMSVRAPVGPINFAKERICIGRGLASIRATEQIHRNFLFYLLLSMQEEIKGKEGAVFASIAKNQIESIQFSKPPFSEQERIVTILDEAFTAIDTVIANTEKNLANARELFESVLNRVFSKKGDGWVEKPLEEIGKTQTGSTPKTSDQSNYGEFISFVKPGDFNTDGTLDYDKGGLSESGAKGARKVPAGSVLMVCIGATIGKCGYCDKDVTTNQQVNALTPSEGASNRFIYYQMLAETFQRKVIHASGQATLPIINKSKWSALTVWLPPKVAEQNKIAAKFDALAEETRSLVRLYERKLAHFANLKQSFLHQAFNGELAL